MKVLRFILGYIKAVWVQILIALICLGIATFFNLKLPHIFGKELLDNVFSNKDRELLMNVCLLIIAIFLIKGILTWLQTYLTSFAGQRMILNMRNDLYSHLQELPINFYERKRTGEVISTLTNDINVVQGALSGGVLNIIQALAMLVGALVLMLRTDWQLTLLTLGVMPAMALVVGFFSNRIRDITDSVQRKLADITTIIQETVSGIRVVKSFSMEKHETKRFKVENEKNFQFVMRSAMASATLTPAMDLLFAIGAVVILWFGGLKVLHGILTTGEFLAFLGLLMLAASPMSMMSGYVNSLSQAAAALSRLYALMQERREIKDAPDAVDMQTLTGAVVFDRVSFSYDRTNNVLNNISLDIKPGLVVALVGPSGAGKSTLVNLIPRFYGHYEGRICIDGYDLDKIKLLSLRRQIGIVPQDTILFGGTIRENIRYGNQAATDEEILAAAKAANAHDFIMELPEGYETEAGERGLKLSGGQRQRIAVARAILRDPKILILDEATSSLDTQAEALVQDALERLMKGRTTFIIAHRLSTIRKADLIVVLKNGQIAEKGTHEQLLSKDEIYAGLYKAQFKDGWGEEHMAVPAQEGL